MNEEEAFSAFLAGLAPHLQEHVAAHVRGDLEAAKAMAMRMDMFHTGGEGSGKQRKNENQKKKGAVQVVEGQKTGESSEVHAVQGQNKGKGQGKGNKKKKERGPVKCYNCGGEHPLRQCKEWLEIRKKYRSGNA